MCDESLISAVRAAAARPEVRAAIAALYADLQQRVAQRRPVCRMSGRCCRFEEWGHRLYVTTMELAVFLAELPMEGPTAGPPWAGCPFQVEGLCSVHSIRPFGCRVYFCDATARDWQEGEYERFHARLRHIHQDLQVPYHYVEWRHALAVLLSAGDL